jgi:HEAT repeat protein
MLEDLERIGEAKDRSATSRLLAELRRIDLTDDRRSGLEETLGRLDDPRAVEPLRTLLHDRGQPDPVRQSAGSILQHMENAPEPTGADRTALWHTKDLVLQRYGLLRMTAMEDEIVLGVLNAPEHPLHADAVVTLSSGFDHARYLRHLIPAFEHPREEVRQAAADAAKWQEPFFAEPGLHRAALDASFEVADEAWETLCYFDTKASLRFAHEQCSAEDETLRELAEGCFRHLSDDFAWSLRNANSTEHLQRWLEPVQALLEPVLAETQGSTNIPRAGAPDKPSTRPMPNWLQSAGAFRTHFGDLDRPWADLEMKLWHPNWSGVPEATRPELVKMLADWPDVLVRARAGYAFAAWNEIDALGELMRDPCWRVQVSARYAARTLSQGRSAIADVLWGQLPGLLGVAAHEALDSAVALSERDTWVPRCADILADTTHEDELRTRALWALDAGKARNEIGVNLHWLSRPAEINWALHASLLDSAHSLGLDCPDLAHLLDVDDLGLQSSLTDFVRS